MAIMDFVGEKFAELRLKKEPTHGLPACFSEFVIGTEEEYRRLALILSYKLCRTRDDEGIDALVDFLMSVAAQPLVSGVVFLISRPSDSPMTLSLEILAPLEQDRDAAAGLGDVVEEAQDTFAQRLPGRISNSFEYIDTTGENMHDLKTQLVETWSSEPDTWLIIWTTFRLPELIGQVEAGQQSQISLSS